MTGALPPGDDDEASEPEANLHLSSSSVALVSTDSFNPSIFTLSGEQAEIVPSQALDSNRTRSQEEQGIMMSTHEMQDSFHAGPHTHLLQRELPGKHLCNDRTFFRILEGNMSKHTVQGQGLRGQRKAYNFMIQVYSAFTNETEDKDHVATCVYAWAVGMPLTWGTSEIAFEKLVSELQLWNIICHGLRQLRQR